MKKKIIALGILIITLFSFLSFAAFTNLDKTSVKGDKNIASPKESHWLLLHRKSGKEYLYSGVSGDVNNSKLKRVFQVKTGASWSPTPLPQLLGKEYWRIVKKESSADNPETAPYFLQLDVPASEEWPYGPFPYEECKDIYSGENIQCDWVKPGYFGLHGINGNNFKLSQDDYGSSGCIRHNDEDITYLFNLLEPEKEEIRYYIQDI
jgi:lipoprotein-anchoring transpeptidase ErfK/SrfK